MNTENLKIGDLLEAIDVCEMGLTMTQTLTIGKLYHINDIYNGAVGIIDDQGDYHDFIFEELLKFFKIPTTIQDPKTMTIKEKTKLLKALAKVVKATEKNSISDGTYSSREKANEKIQEILKTINVD